MPSNSSILITGGTGSFGHFFLRLTLERFNPRRVIIFSRDEMKQWEMAKMDRNGGGPDDSFSLEPAEFSALCKTSRTAWTAIGKVDYARKPSEASNVQFRRSLYFAKDIRKGEVIPADAVRSIRPGFGVLPKFMGSIVGKTARRDIEAATPVLNDYIA